MDEVADAKVKCLLRAVPAAVPGIAFLSAGQSGELASARLDAMNVRFQSRLPWAMAFSFSRAIQQPDLAEWDYGEYEGQTTAEIHEARPGWKLFRDGCQRGETPAQISSRVDRIIARLRAMEGDVAIFSHGYLGRVMGARWIGLPVEQAQHFLLNTASLSIIGYEHDRSDESAIVLWYAVPNDAFDMMPSPVPK